MKKMLQLNFCFLFVAILTFFSSCKSQSDAPAALKNDRYVVVLSMDGFRPDYTVKAHTPTLDSIAGVGVKSKFRPSYPSNTFPNHYSMATGLHPDHHGLVNNTFYAPDLDSIYSIGNRNAVANPAFYGGEPIWNTAQKQGVKAASFFWVGSETAIQDMQPSIWKPFDSSVSYYDRADSVIAWLQLPEDVRPHLIMWYIEEPDAIGHYAGPDSSATFRKVEELDKVLGYFFTKVREVPVFKRTDFVILSDHGMASYYPENYVNLNDYLPRDSFQFAFDGIPTTLYPKGNYADKAMEILKTVPHVKAYRKGEMPEKYVYGTNPRIGEIIVMPDIGTYLNFRATSTPRFGASHGYDNFSPDMEAIFYAVGPSFKKGAVTPIMPNVNLYLLIARLLGIQPAPNDGKDEEIAPLFK